MGDLKKVCQQLAAFNASVETRVREVRENPEEAKVLLEKWQEIQESVPEVETPTGLKLPRLPLPLLDEPGAIARYLNGEGLPGEFPYLSSSYAEMYLDPMDPHEVPPEEPTVSSLVWARRRIPMSASTS